jgi:hypothetical protein
VVLERLRFLVILDANNLIAAANVTAENWTSTEDRASYYDRSDPVEFNAVLTVVTVAGLECFITIH